MTDPFAHGLEALRAESLYRELREVSGPQDTVVERDGRCLINFSSNDYLGLANEPRLREAAIAALQKFGTGAGASRLISGTQSVHVELEDALAKWKKTEAALCFSSGYAAATGTIPALAGKKDVILLDKLCHASLIDGARLSGATLRVFPHNHPGKLESHLEWARREHAKARILILTESVFSMDGDCAPLRDLVRLKKRFDAMLMVDEAHAVGVFGPQGRGLAAEEEVDGEIDVQMGTLSKALGGSGGYIAGSGSLVEWLINRARSFIFSTAPSPAAAGAARAAIEFLQTTAGEERRARLRQNIERLMDGLPARPGISARRSAIIPWVVGGEKAALDLSRQLLDAGLLVPAIRYPTVAKGSARLRITITARHDGAQIAALANALRQSGPDSV